MHDAGGEAEGLAGALGVRGGAGPALRVAAVHSGVDGLAVGPIDARRLDGDLGAAHDRGTAGAGQVIADVERRAIVIAVARADPVRAGNTSAALAVVPGGALGARGAGGRRRVWRGSHVGDAGVEALAGAGGGRGIRKPGSGVRDGLDPRIRDFRGGVGLGLSRVVATCIHAWSTRSTVMAAPPGAAVEVRAFFVRIREEAAATQRKEEREPEN